MVSRISRFVCIAWIASFGLSNTSLLHAQTDQPTESVQPTQSPSKASQQSERQPTRSRASKSDAKGNDASSALARKQDTPVKLEIPGATSEVYKSASGTDLYLYIFYPEGHNAEQDRRAAAIFFFGGGWNSGSPKQFEQHARYLASRGMVTALADYRVKSRQGTTPRECVADGKSAVRYLRQHAFRLGIDSNRIVASGGSAGGHVAAATGTLPAFDDAEDNLNISPRPNALILFNPVFDNGPDGGWGHSVVQSYWKEISPAHNITAKTPPTILFLGDSDALVPVETAKRFQQQMQNVGVNCQLELYEQQVHGFFNESKGGPEIFLDTIRKMDQFLVQLRFLEGTPTAAQVQAASGTNRQKPKLGE